MEMTETTSTIGIQADRGEIVGDLTLPAKAKALIVFAHGSGSSRFSPRNRFVARALNERGFGSLLGDLLTAEEGIADDRTLHYRFNIRFLTERLVKFLDWARQDQTCRGLPIGLFGASTGAAAALMAATVRRDSVGAIVSRGGRPDLTGTLLFQVEAPTLFLVGTHDHEVQKLNQEAMAAMPLAVKELQLVEGASHLFEEPGALERVAESACDWFDRHLLSGHERGQLGKREAPPTQGRRGADQA